MTHCHNGPCLFASGRTALAIGGNRPTRMQAHMHPQCLTQSHVNRWECARARRHVNRWMVQQAGWPEALNSRGRLLRGGAALQPEPPQPLCPGLLLPLPLPLLHLLPCLQQPPLLLLAAPSVSTEVLPA